MPKNTATTAQPSCSGRGSAAGQHTAQVSETISLVEIRSGLFLNIDHIVSVRVLPQEDGNVYAVVQMSNGDKFSFTRDEFSTITGEEPRAPARLPQKPHTESQVD